MAYAMERSEGQAANAAVAELVKRVSEQRTRLAHHEVEIAKAEAGRAGVGGGKLVGGAAVFGFYALSGLTATAVLGLATVVGPWLAAVIVAVALAAIAGALALHGKSRLARATPPMPERAAQSANEDVRWTKSRVQMAR
jgi:Flp pilus assembly protein TadB